MMKTQLTVQGKEFTDVIYDTLMQNTQHPQLDIDQVTDQFVETERGEIEIVYKGRTYLITIKER